MSIVTKLFNIPIWSCYAMLCKNYFSHRNVPTWKSLTESVVSDESVNSLKSRLDKYGLSTTLYMTTELIHLLPEVQ